MKEFKGIYKVIYTILPRLCLLFPLLSSPAVSAQQGGFDIRKDTLRIIPLDSVHWVHESYLVLEDGRSVACNGMIAVDQGQAIVLDTPVDVTASEILLDWITNEKKLTVTALIINHHHVDCLGGMQVFSKRGIPSYASDITKNEAMIKHKLHIEHSFTDSLVLNFGSSHVVNYYLGRAHAPGNIVSMFPRSKFIFGGCMIKSLGMSYGNLEDADVEAWPKTIRKLANMVKKRNWTVIPGHGAPGGRELLEYTINLMEGYGKPSRN